MTADSPTKIWWTNGSLFVFIHLAAAYGVYNYPYHSTCRATLILAFLLWQAACFGITIGYHRLYSHRAFKTGLIPKVVLALLGASAFQGSIRWWCLRHRMHHRYTDDPVHDPHSYSATRGLLWSHMGWIFFKPDYEKLALIDKGDLDRDIVARWQHRHYVLLAISTAFIFPTLVGLTWGDPLGAFVWGGLVARILVWHCTFLVNSLAHWDGIQPYSDENTSRTNLLIALLTCGEGNHNFHTFPQDFRSGPSIFDWDPSKWIILLLYRVGLASHLRRACKADLNNALSHMAQKHRTFNDTTTVDEVDGLAPLTMESVCELLENQPGRCILVIGPYVVDATEYLIKHPGGARLLRQYSVRKGEGKNMAVKGDLVERWTEATWAFEGGINTHSRIAKTQLKALAIGRLI